MNVHMRYRAQEGMAATVPSNSSKAAKSISMEACTVAAICPGTQRVHQQTNALRPDPAQTYSKESAFFARANKQSIEIFHKPLAVNRVADNIQISLRKNTSMQCCSQFLAT